MKNSAPSNDIAPRISAQSTTVLVGVYRNAEK